VGNFSFTAAGVSIAIIEEPQSPKVEKTQTEGNFHSGKSMQNVRAPTRESPEGH
jgi:hypothetical protein